MPRLSEAPQFTEVRAGAGAITADSATINDTNYPLTRAFDPSARRNEILVYWEEGGGTVAPFDYLDLQLLQRDGTMTLWVEGEIAYGVRRRQIVPFRVDGSSQCMIRVVAVSCAAGTDLSISAAARPLD